jgi:hypothetical protein
MAKPSYVWTGSAWLPIASAFPTAHQRIISEEAGTSLTLDVNDTGKALVFSNSSAVTVTIPADSTYEFEIGQTFLIVQEGTGTVSVTGAVGVTLSGLSVSAPVDIAGQYGVATLIKIDDDEWVIFGNIA